MLHIRLIRRLFLALPVMLALIALTAGGILPVAEAQNSTPAPTLTITGNIESVTGSKLVVSGLQVDVSYTAGEKQTYEVGQAVQVTGVMVNGVIIAQTVIIIIIVPDATATPTLVATTDPLATPTVTPTLEATSTVDPNATLTMTPAATAIDDDGTVIIIEGPVTQININIITIYDITIQVSPDDPILEDLEVGDLIRVIGNLSFDNGVIVVVVVNITYVNIVIIDVNPGGNIPDGCRIIGSKKGQKLKCSNKKRS